MDYDFQSSLLIIFVYVVPVVNACLCNIADSTRPCLENPPATAQNSAVNICVYTDSTDVVINQIKTMTLSQAGISFAAVTDGAGTSISSISGMGTQREYVITRLVSVFYSDTDTNPSVDVNGEAVLGFSNTQRKLVNLRGADNDHRVAQADETTTGEGTFELSMDLAPVDEEAESGAGLIEKTSTVVGGIVIGLMLVSDMTM